MALRLLAALSLAVPVAAERAWARRSGSQYVGLDDGTASVAFVSEADLANATATMTERLRRMKEAMDAKLASSFEVVDGRLAQARLAAQDEVKEFIADAQRKLESMQLQEQRLRLAVRHGAHGRCCCAAPSRARCEWVDFSLLSGYAHSCPAESGQDYVDHHTVLSKSQGEVVTVDTLIDSCLGSQGWHVHIDHRGDAQEDMLSPETRRLVEKLHGQPIADAP
ncbi:unnamed protein product [Prorocentrum cordatum]|uniref:Uncharacterized protein n=1 Tax=Prorocentrum cordatum TaxID=2364126 RepID=A0ABN9TAN5_9DINO|nr:unnamed protein product [Polarella glacialis]